jgi:OOP family OmpA-OmpF porin
MRLSSIAILAGAFVSAAILCLIAATFAAGAIERSSENGVREALDRENLSWADVASNGLQLQMTGTAPTEAERFRALTVAGTVVDASRVIDGMQVAATEALAAPRFSIEMLRNDEQISLIGLIPTATNREALIERIDNLRGVSDIADLLETADYPVPDTWGLTLDYAISALKLLPRSKISLSAGEMTITAMTESAEERRDTMAELERKAPGPIDLTLDISAPRPVISPFTLRYIIDEEGGRFDACSADTEAARLEILTTATKAKHDGPARCTIGLGVPSPEWGKAASSTILALSQLGGGSITMSDADISLIAAKGTPQDTFDRVVGELENTLPEVFALTAVLPDPDEEKDKGPAEFTATRSPEGQVQIRGRIRDELSRKAVDSYARSRFGSDAVYTAARLDPDLNETWSLRILAALEGLSKLSNGVATVTDQAITIRGNTGNPDASAEVARLLSDRLGEGQRFDINIAYQEALDPVASLPTPQECVAEIAAIQETRKINFEPGSANVDSESLGILDDIAAVLKECGQLRLEIAGHTDSQGREEMNQRLSQDRADAVVTELRQRRVNTRDYLSKGYGESDPIAENDTEEGREANRRIEFRLIRTKAEGDGDTTLESQAQTSAESNVDPASQDTTTDSQEEEAKDEQN